MLRLDIEYRSYGNRLDRQFMAFRNMCFAIDSRTIVKYHDNLSICKRIVGFALKASGIRVCRHYSGYRVFHLNYYLFTTL